MGLGQKAGRQSRHIVEPGMDGVRQNRVKITERRRCGEAERLPHNGGKKSSLGFGSGPCSPDRSSSEGANRNESEKMLQDHHGCSLETSTHPESGIWRFIFLVRRKLGPWRMAAGKDGRGLHGALYQRIDRVINIRGAFSRKTCTHQYLTSPLATGSYVMSGRCLGACHFSPKSPLKQHLAQDSCMSSILYL